MEVRHIRYYSKDRIKAMILAEEPELSEAQITEKAVQIHRALNTLDIHWKRSNKRFYSKVCDLEEKGNLIRR
jgi:hypothetical protein